MKTKFSKILVPIDGSKFSMDAAKYGIEVSKQYDAELYILNILLPVDLGLRLHSFGTESLEQGKKLIEENKKQISEWFDSIKNFSKEYANGKEIKINTKIIESSSIVSNIIDYAEKEMIDLIVIGTRGRTGIKRLLLGSVASQVVIYSHCPVLIVR